MIAPTAADDSREAIFKRWLQQHTGLVFKVARTFAPSDADRDDLVQEILLQLWRSLPRFEGKAKESTWIYRVALNTALAWHRSENKRRAAHTPLLPSKNSPSRTTWPGVSATNWWRVSTPPSAACPRWTPRSCCFTWTT